MGINVIFNKFDYEISQRKKEVWDKYNKVIQWGRQHPLRFAETFLGLEFTDHQKYIFMATWTSRIAVWVMSRSSGKALDINTPISTPDGLKPIKDIKIGDYVLGGDLKPTKVIQTSDIFLGNECYNLLFDDGENIVADENHLWLIASATDDVFLPMLTKDIFIDCNKRNKEYFIPSIYSLKGKKIVKIEKTKTVPTKCIMVDNESHTYLCGEKQTITHNSFLSAPYVMTRSLLIPNHKSYIMSVTGNQSQETFKKMENLAMGQIASVTGSTSVFLNELVKQNAGMSGFTHDKNSYSCGLYNGSEISTLNSVAKNIVGIRSNLNLYDEAGKIERDFYDLTKPFAVQDTNFITGSGINTNCYPQQFPNQIIYASSAEDVFTELWDAYKNGAKEMIMGNLDFFVCDIDCNFSLHPKMNGEPYKPMLTQTIIDDAIAKNEFRANREYFNKFDTAGGQDCLVSKAVLMKYSKGYLPVLKYEDGKQYVIVYDPSSKLDNSVVLVAEQFYDSERGWMMKIVNCQNLIEALPGGMKKILQKPDQLEKIKELIVKYNGPANDFDNIKHIIFDGGAGGGGFDLAQFLMPGWNDHSGKYHIGIIDLNDKYCKEVKDRFPGAKNILTLSNFTKDKVRMYENAQDALNQGLIIFPNDSNGRNEIELENINNEGEVEYVYTKLDSEELRAITEIEILKIELMSTQRNNSNGRISFDTMPSKKNEGVKDDRSDCIAMLSQYLMEIRAKDKLSNYSPEKKDFSKILQTKSKKSQNPFGGANPFANMGSNPFFS
jgi:hypothetical protein